MLHVSNMSQKSALLIVIIPESRLMDATSQHGKLHESPCSLRQEIRWLERCGPATNYFGPEVIGLSSTQGPLVRTNFVAMRNLKEVSYYKLWYTQKWKRTGYW